MDEESQRDEMNAAIRAQRERGAVPRSMLPPEDDLPVREELPPAPEPAPPAPADPPAQEHAPAKRGLFSRLLGR